MDLHEFCLGAARLSLQAGVLAILVAFLQLALRGVLAPRWRCWLWGLVALRLCLPVSLGSAWSLFNLLPRWNPAPTLPASPQSPPPITRITPVPVVPLVPEVPSVPEVPPAPTSSSSPALPSPQPSLPPLPSWPLALAALWAAGAAFLASRTALACRAASRLLRRSSPCTDPAVLAVAEDARLALGVRARPPVLELDGLHSPALHGFLRPRLLLPRGLAARLPAAQLRHVLLHEFAHVRRRDIALNWLLAVLQILHWFNPAVWFAFARLRAERELACDELALRAASDADPEAYGRTLLALLSAAPTHAPSPATVGILEGRADLRRRLRFIAAFRPGRRAGALALVVLALAGAVSLTDAQAPDAAASPKDDPTNLPPVVPLVYTNVIRAAENRELADVATWGAVPRGSNVLGGVEFRVDGLVKLLGLAAQRQGKEYRQHVTLPCPTNTYGAIHLLAGTSGKGEANHRVADVVWRYADGTFKRSLLNYAGHVRDVWRAPFEDPARVHAPLCKVVWTGTATNAARKGRTVRLYRATLANPDPSKPVAFVQLQSAMDEPTLSVLAVSLDPLAPGARPDPTPDLEPRDPPLTRHLAVSVLDAATSNRLAGANVKATVKAEIAGSNVSFERAAFSDGSGTADLLLPESGVTEVDAAVTLKDYVDGHVALKASETAPLPATATVKLSGGSRIGGVALDEAGQPVAGVKISVYRYWTGDEPPPPSGKNAGFSHADSTTGADGRWSAAGIPTNLFHRIGVSAIHPDYVGERVNSIAEKAGVEKALLEQRHEFRMKSGVVVQGIVVDAQGAPVPGAKVQVGMRFFPNTRETRTGADGRFRVAGMAEGESSVFASAKGHGPAAVKLTLAKGMPEVRVALVAGHVVRGRVQDAEGDPIEGATVSVESSSAMQDPLEGNLDFRTKTDKAGHWEWNEAPDLPVSFAFFKEGFADKSGVRIAASDADVITVMNKSREVRGVVLDADSGAPVGEFTLQPRGNWWTQSDTRSFKADDGRFSMTLAKEHYDKFYVTSPDHEPTDVPIPAATDGAVDMTIRLKASKNAEGTVVDAAGNPVAGATVAASGPNAWSVTLGHGRLVSQGDTPVVTSDADGHFAVGTRSDTQFVVAAHPSGFGAMPWVQFQQARRLVLAPYGRIEGTFKGNRDKDGTAAILLQLGSAEAQLGIAADFGTYRAEVGADGRFAMDSVPPGTHQLVRLVPTGNNGWMHRLLQEVTIRSGETTSVELGTSGPRVVARIENGTGKELDWRFVGAHVRTPLPAGLKQPTNEAEAKAMMANPEIMKAMQAAMKSMRLIAATVEAGGTVSAEDVAPGNYQLVVHAMDPAVATNPGKPMMPLGTGTLDFNVPAGAPADRDIDLGPIRLVPPNP